MTRMMTMTMTMAVVLSMLLPVSTRGQEREGEVLERRTPNVSGMVAGAALGSAGGMFLGGWAGYHIETGLGSCEYCEYRGLGGILLGAFVGSVVMTPVLAHGLGGGDGDIGTGILMTALATAGGVALVSVVEGGMVMVPLSQVFAAVATEVSTGKRRQP